MNPLILGGIISVAKDAIGKLFQTDEDKAQAQAILDKTAGDLQLEVAKIQGDLLKVDANGNNLQKSWRPLLMIGFGAVLMVILSINFIIFPIMEVFGKVPPFIVMPEEIWSLLELVMGGCVVGRSVEKVTGIIRRK